jgi:hypothetical protein
MKRRPIAWLVVLVLALVLAGCRPAAPAAGNQVLDAGAEATQIIAQAQATSVVLRARMTASALLQVGDQASAATPVPAGTVAPAGHPAVASLPSPAGPTLSPRPRSTPIPTPGRIAALSAGSAVTNTHPMSYTVQLENVSLGTDGRLIVVNFLAPYRFTDSMTVRGRAYVIDEATGETYQDIPVMPIIGPLVGRPNANGLQSYIMFYNNDLAVKKGTVVTVVLGDFKQEHVTVK